MILAQLLGNPAIGIVHGQVTLNLTFEQINVPTSLVPGL